LRFGIDDLFYSASKIVGVLIQAETLLLAVLALSFIALWRRHHLLAATYVGSVLGALAVLAMFPLGDVALFPLEQQYPGKPEVTDVTGIIVLGGGEEPVRSAAAQQPILGEAGERFTAAITLAHRFPNATVLFTGKTTPLSRGKPSKAGPIEALFLGAGIKRERLVLEARARTTAENAAFALKIARTSRPGGWLLVTSAWHMPRAIATFCTAGWKGLVPWPTDYRALAFGKRIGWDLARNLEDLNTGVKEWVGFVAYWATGRASTHFPDGCLK
jgi:uncharacterized SAM-binding protein YcdF (DUF218 family)